MKEIHRGGAEYAEITQRILINSAPSLPGTRLRVGDSTENCQPQLKLDSKYLHEDFALVWPIEFREDDALPLTENRLALSDGDREAMAYDDVSQMRIGIVTVAI